MQSNGTQINKTEIIKQFVVDNCSPTRQERLFVSGRDSKGGEYNRLKEFLGSGNVFQSGSYARHTAITPLNDLDVFYILPQQLQYKDMSVTKRFLDSIASDLQKKYRENNINVAITTQTHSICINFPDKDGDFTIDIIPAHRTEIPNGLDDYFFIIPEVGIINNTRRKSLYENKKAEEMQWIKTDPKGYKTIIRHLDEVSNNVLRRTVRIIKQWKHWQKDQHKGKTIEFKMKSFHLELITAEIVNENKNLGVLEVLGKVFTNISSSYLANSCFPDRASDQNDIRFIDDYVEELSSDEIKLIKRHCRNALHLVRMAIITKQKGSLCDYLLRLTRSNEEFMGSYGFRKSTKTLDGSPFYIETTNQNGDKFRSGIVPTKNGDKLTFKHVLPRDGFNYIKSQITTYYWKVRNTGTQALKENSLRGEISKNAPRVQAKNGFETTKYKGVHYVECYGVNEQSREILAYAICSVRIDLEDEIIRKQY